MIAGTAVSLATGFRFARWAGTPDLNRFQLTSLWIVSFSAAAALNLGLYHALKRLARRPWSSAVAVNGVSRGAVNGTSTPARGTSGMEDVRDLSEAWQCFWRKVDEHDARRTITYG